MSIVDIVTPDSRVVVSVATRLGKGNWLVLLSPCAIPV